MRATDSSAAAPSPAATPTRSLPAWLPAVIVYAALFLALLLIQQGCFAVARVPISLTLTPTHLALSADGQALSLALPAAPSQAVFISSSALDREFQLDSTDSINNFTVNTDYIISIADSPYYRFQSWMRDVDSYSSWRSLSALDTTTERTLPNAFTVGDTQDIQFTAGHAALIQGAIQRPEAPVSILVLCGRSPCARVVFNRNDRYIRVDSLLSSGSVAQQRQLYFPTQPLPFLAEDVYLVAHIALWSLALLGILALLHTMLLVALARASRQLPAFPAQSPPRPSAWARYVSFVSRVPGSFSRRNHWDILTAAIVFASFLFTCFIALVQYHAEPHILDASAYYFQAKIFASGHLAVAAPADSAAFQGPFMVSHGGRWFSQYPPGTSAVLAIGFFLRLPWIVEPALGALALWGVYRIGCRLFSRSVACLAVCLGAISAFYSYLAASYLSHTVALCFGVYFVLFLLRFADMHRVRDLCIAAVFWSALLLTRELSAAVIGVGAALFILIVYRRSLLRDRLQMLTAAFSALGVALLGLALYVLYNRMQTGDALTTPRALFSPADRYGFGAGIGFYGQHTLAAGLVILDQLLTVLQIDLFGWPFYLTLAFVPLAFLRRSAQHTWDWFCLVLFAALTLAQVGYFYHGIYLGPRYLYDTLPFVLLLTARGITNLVPWLADTAHRLPTLATAARAHVTARMLVGITIAVLLACTMIYYLPRQLAIYANFTGLPAYEPVDAITLYAFHPSSAIVVTDNWYVYNYMLWPLNDPNLTGPTLYAYAPSPSDTARLQAEYPTRTLYVVAVDPAGRVTFTPYHH